MTTYYVKPDSDNKFPDKDTAPFLELAPTTQATITSTTN